MRTFTKVLGLALVGSVAGVSSAMATAVTTCPVAEAVVTPDVARQATSATVGMIADRVASVASGIGSSAVMPQNASMGIAVSCNQDVGLTEDAGQPAYATESTKGTANMPTETATAPVNGVWASSSATWLKKTDPRGEFSGTVVTGLVGYDRKIMKDTIVGLAVGVENAFIKTAYNTGSIRGRSLSLAPYVGYALTDWLTIDATIGHAWVYYDYTQDNVASVETLGGSTASRWFGSADLNAVHRIDSVVLRSGIGYMRVSETENGFTNSSGTNVASTAVNIGQLRGTLGAGYEVLTSWGKLTPSAFVRLQYEAPHSGASTLATGYVTSTDTTSAVFGVSVDALIDKVWTVNVYGSTEEFRQNTSARTLGVNARYVF